MKLKTIAELEQETEIYGLKVAGDALAPEVRNGQWVVVQPQSINPKLASLSGVVIVAAIREENVGITATEHLCLMRRNADGDLVDADGGFVPAGQWRPLGIVTSVMTILVE